MSSLPIDEAFPHSLTIEIPFPSQRLATAALRSLAVDQELSALVKRDFDLVSATNGLSGDIAQPDSNAVLQVHYKATTPRMLRVAVNGFFESLSVVVQVMEELDVDVLHEKGIEGLEGVQGVEQGLTGTAVGVRS
ncbi:transcription factor Pcc1-domain-containing protein [Neohortaea acidophila]|uniref:Transcription factor Pcc1-domain-containing protein n=1 Tax=Neohortaea acidophila TaxID=245834 RepID=A0A6A6PVF5_9PEZI|nr:transcription factor Pcc1-domain-containing protein [Neohortaea acidophila]KAF2483982.1 transcription factor Pcc1-domain-containing protein [Neohortaea acidophila]